MVPWDPVLQIEDQQSHQRSHTYTIRYGTVQCTTLLNEPSMIYLELYDYDYDRYADMLNWKRFNDLQTWCFMLHRLCTVPMPVPVPSELQFNRCTLTTTTVLQIHYHNITSTCLNQLCSFGTADDDVPAKSVVSLLWELWCLHWASWCAIECPGVAAECPGVAVEVPGVIHEGSDVASEGWCH